MIRIKLAGTALALATIFFFGMAGCTLEWQEFTSDEGGFTINMPGEPKVKKDFQNIGNGVSMSTTYYEVMPMHGLRKMKFTAAYSEILAPGQEMNWDDKAARQGSKSGIRNEGGQVLQDNDITIDGVDGWEFVSKAKDGNISIIRMARVDNVLYTLEIVHPDGKDMSQDIENFFGSFKFTDMEDDDYY